MARITNREIANHVAARRDFQANSTTGTTRSPGQHIGWTGYLPAEWREEFFADDEIDYIVHSYQTPIAWHTSAGWVIPDVKYSVTTSKIQGYVRQGAGSFSSTLVEIPASEGTIPF